MYIPNYNLLSLYTVTCIHVFRAIWYQGPTDVFSPVKTPTLGIPWLLGVLCRVEALFFPHALWLSIVIVLA